MEKRGFFSYARFDDEHHGRLLSEIRSYLEHEVQALVGRATFKLTQDVALEEMLGTEFEPVLWKTLEASSVFVAMVTPSFIESRWCREELERYTNRLTSVDRDDLLIPLLLTPLDNVAMTRENQRVISRLDAYQRVDITKFRTETAVRADLKIALAGVVKRIARSVTSSGPLQRHSEPSNLSPAADPGPLPPVSAQVLLAGSLHNDASYPRVFELVGELSRELVHRGLGPVVSGTSESTAIDPLAVRLLSQRHQQRVTVVASESDLRTGGGSPWAAGCRLVDVGALDRRERRERLLLHSDVVVTVGGSKGVAHIVETAAEGGVPAIPLPFTGGFSSTRSLHMNQHGLKSMDWTSEREPREIAEAIADHVASVALTGASLHPGGRRATLSSMWLPPLS